MVHTLRLVQPRLPTVQIATQESTSIKLLALLNPIVKNAVQVNTVLNLREVLIATRVAPVNTTIKMLALWYPIVKIAVLVNTVRKLRVKIVKSVPLVHITIKFLKRRLVNLAVKESITI